MRGCAKIWTLLLAACAVGLTLVSCSADEAVQTGATTAVAAGATATGEALTAVTTLATATAGAEPTLSITIAAVGDVMIHKATLRTALAESDTPGEYDFRPVFAPVAPYLSAADYTVVNLETRLAGSDFAYTSYPRFNSPASVADALVACGVDLAATANNHTLDKDWIGIVNTLDNLDAAGIAHIGTHRSLEEKNASTPFIVDIKGIKVAFLNYTDYLNGFTPPKDHKDYAVNVLDLDTVALEAAMARDAGAEVVIAVLHWGKEYCTKPNWEQILFAEGSADQDGLLARGVDVILGSHPHVIEPVVHLPLESDLGIRDTYVFYSLGNFVSGMVKPHTDSGVIAYVHIEKQGSEVRVTGLSYLPVWVQQSGAYPRKVRVLPVLPGLEPLTDTAIAVRDRRRMDEAWAYVDGMFYQPDENIVPLDPAILSLGLPAGATAGSATGGDGAGATAGTAADTQR